MKSKDEKQYHWRQPCNIAYGTFLSMFYITILQQPIPSETFLIIPLHQFLEFFIKFRVIGVKRVHHFRYQITMGIEKW